MKVFLRLGKVVAGLFWLVVLVNLLSPFAKPFDLLLYVLGGVILLAHVAELTLFNYRLQGRPQPGLDRLQVLLFGVFHLLGLPQPAVKREAGHA
ncbi:DUF1145 domain-containing protein [Pseudomonas sp. 2FE]|uniref:DUF1145 domain-containing protein n=1 Tax=Pseudomonas sp. 2FE TaxID=2502190 RepID=UPI0010F6E95D|nr:DUF1145 domain-containing protein [Pseudomonas sp. 2FE]